MANEAPVVSVNISGSGYNVSGTLTVVSGTVTSIIWKSEGQTAVGNHFNFKYSSYGPKSILLTYKDGYQNEYGSVYDQTLTDPVNGGGGSVYSKIEGDVFADKPFFIQPECTGDVRITANITKLSDKLDYPDDSKISTWEASINFDSFSIEGGVTQDIYVDPTGESHPSDEWIVAKDKKIDNLEYIPAFYNYANVTVDIRFLETDDTDDLFDVKCGMKWEIPEYPDWFESNTTYTGKVMTNLITSSNSETLINGTSPGVNHPCTFTINTWNGIPPFEIKDCINHNVEDATETAIYRACLSTPRFWFELTNNLTSKVTLSNVSIKFTFYYNSNGLLMNVRTEGEKSKETYKLFTLSKGTEVTRNSGINYPLYGVVDGFKLDEIVRVHGYYAKWDSASGVYFPSCLPLQAITSTGGPDHPPVLYKSYISVSDADKLGISQTDFERLAYKGLSSEDYCKVLTPQILAADDHYRTINVKCKTSDGSYGASPDSVNTIFEITTTPNTSIDELVTVNDLETYIDSLHYFGKSYEFASVIDVPRANISPSFRERLYTTYKTAPTLQSTFGEPMYAVNFVVNDYGEYFPIKHGETLEFSESLIHAMVDGVKSSEIFTFSAINPNKIGIQSPDKHKYRVKFKYSYDVYRDCYAFTSDDF